MSKTPYLVKSNFKIIGLKAKSHNLKLEIMLRWTITFVIIATISGILGFGGMAGASVGIAKVLFFVFIVLSALSLLKIVVKDN
ncbi:DUF1328 domain-containing protein [Winogradskyella luteola]|uniref:DUF1328 domain-containing protein n=1 Tax=Winogradskyella luteola TaxID=2828330 RepID=UPI003F752DBD